MEEPPRPDQDVQRQEGEARQRLAAARRWIPQPQATQAVFFDVGYTLLDPFPSVPVIVRDALDRHDIVVETARLEEALPAAESLFIALAREHPTAWGDERTIGQMWRRYFAEMLRRALDTDNEAVVDRAADLSVAAFDQATSYAPYPDVEPTLRALHHRGFKMGVVSDWGVALSVILRHFNLTRYFDFTVISATARRAKPDPALFQLALERGDVTADYALHVGDSYVRDALGARAVGVTPVLIDRAGVTPGHVPDCPLIYNLYELLDLLEVPRPDDDVVD